MSKGLFRAAAAWKDPNRFASKRAQLPQQVSSMAGEIDDVWRASFRVRLGDPPFAVFEVHVRPLGLQQFGLSDQGQQDQV